MPLFVLVHSPSVGPATWTAVAGRLAAAGCDVTVPSLLGVADGGAPYWPHVAGAVTAHLASVPPDQPLVLVAHSNAGLFLPVIRSGLAQPVTAAVFVDAAVPARHGQTPVAPAELLVLLRGQAGQDGRLPRWTDWWDEADIAPMFADQRDREIIIAEQPRLPLAYYEEQVPVANGWDDDVQCGYIQFSEAYDGPAADASQRGWTVRTLPGEHLHQVVDPDATAALLLELAGSAPG